jgi:hypothetical protein
MNPTREEIQRGVREQDAPEFLTIAEYNNKGDLSLETPIEPALRVHRVGLGGISDSLQNDTLLVVLFASAPCEFAFVMDDGHFVGDGPFTLDHLPEVAHFVPIGAGSEVSRIVHLNARLRIAVRGMAGIEPASGPYRIRE